MSPESKRPVQLPPKFETNEHEQFGMDFTQEKEKEYKLENLSRRELESLVAEFILESGVEDAKWVEELSQEVRQVKSSGVPGGIKSMKYGFMKRIFNKAEDVLKKGLEPIVYTITNIEQFKEFINDFIDSKKRMQEKFDSRYR